MEAFANMLNSGGEITFAALFIALLYYVMKTNEAREKQYRETITTMSMALANYEDLKENVQEIRNKLYNN